MTSSHKTYALLGATGSTGSAILTQLLSRPTSEMHINVYVRSQARLEKQFPGIQGIKNVSIYTGAMNETSMLGCLRNASVILNAIGVNKPDPNCSVAKDTAIAIVEALRKLSSTSKVHLIYLSSGSLTERFKNEAPAAVTWITQNGLYCLYEDMRQGIAYYRSEGVESGLLELSLACPGAISLGPSYSTGKGVEVSDKEFSDMVTYQELAYTMIKIADEPGQWKGKEVFMKSAEPPVFGQLAMLIVCNVLPGLVIRFVPASYPVFTKLGIL